MSRIQFGICLAAAAATGCSSQPPEEIPLGLRTRAAMSSLGPRYQGLTALPPAEAVRAHQAPDQLVEGFPFPAQTGSDDGEQYPRHVYETLSARPPAESRALRFHLSSQTFYYFEDGEPVLSGPIASGKPGSTTPTGKFSVLSKERDKQSSLYTNEIGTQAWMPYSLQFYGNYFIHEGWLPGYAASHGCIRLGHYDARLLFERMKIGDPVTVSN
jgi:hypothetical protein